MNNRKKIIFYSVIFLFFLGILTFLKLVDKNEILEIIFFISLFSLVSLLNFDMARNQEEYKEGIIKHIYKGDRKSVV